MAAKWFAQANYFSTEMYRKSGLTRYDLIFFGEVQILKPKKQMNAFVEIESIELEEVWYYNWRWGFKFKSGLQSDFNSDSVL